jgi:hypothetical protein
MNDFIKGSLLAGVVALTMPSFAQKNEEKNKEEVQQIIISLGLVIKKKER